MTARFFSLLTLSFSFSLMLIVSCSGGGGGGGSSAVVNDLSGSSSGQILANVGGAFAASAPAMPGSSSFVFSSPQYGIQAVSIPGFTVNSEGSWVGTTSDDGVTPSLHFYDSGNQLVVTTSSESSFATVTQIKVSVTLNRSFTGGYTIAAQLESSLESFNPLTPEVFPSSFSFSLKNGTTGSITGEFGEITITSLSFTANDEGLIVGDGTYVGKGTVPFDGESVDFNASVAFNNSGCKGATVRQGLIEGSGDIIGTAVMGSTGLEFTTEGVTYTLDRVVSVSASETSCSLDNINFTNYAAMSGSLSSVGSTIGCSHQISSLDEYGNYYVHWVLSGASGVYIEGVFNSSNTLTGQSIVGINSETGRPYCVNAPNWANCVE